MPGLLSDDTGYYRAGLLPMRRNLATGETELAFPGLLADPINAWTNSIDAINAGQKPSVNDALDIGLTMAPGSVVRGGASAAAAKETPGAVSGIRAYHGSPHSFDGFDTSKIGTGEGAQAYGHGLYFAEAEPVARSYRELANREISVNGRPLFDPASPLSPTMRGIVGDELRMSQRLGANGDDAVRDAMMALKQMAESADKPELRQRFSDAHDAAGKLLGKPWSISPGHMYEVNIKAPAERFLDWDLPLSRQPQVADRLGLGRPFERDLSLEATLRPGTPEYLAHQARMDGRLGSLANPDITGEQLYRQMTGAGAAPAASRMLSDAGIPGIRYLDGGSRAAGEGTSNYVVFDPALVEIMRKYGIPGIAAGGAAAADMGNAQAAEPYAAKFR